MSGITETRELKSVRVLAERKAVEVEWADVVRRADGSIIATTPFNRAYSRYDRAMFLSDLASEPTALTYADLAGLEEHPPVPEPDQGELAV